MSPSSASPAPWRRAGSCSLARVRGDARPDSDWDLAVIVDSDLPWCERERLAYRALRGLGIPVEVVVLTPEELEAERGLPGSLSDAVEREGRVLYDAEAPR